MLTTEQREALKTAIAYLDAGGNPRTAESLRLILASAAPTEGREAEENVSLIAKMSAKLYTCHVANVSVAIDDFRDLLAYVHDLRCRIATAPTMSEAARDVLAERGRQVTAEGWTPEHDDEHAACEMADAAAAYALHYSGWSEGGRPVEVWPADWSNKWWKPSTPRRDLIKAGALILAEIERIDRAAAKGGSDA